MELDHEKFQTVKELADLGVQVAGTRALLRQLKSETEEYLKEREGMAVERVKTVLKASMSLLKEADQYLETFRIFLTTTGSIREDIGEMVASLSALREETATYSSEFNKYVKEKTAQIAEDSKHIKLERATLDKELIK